MTKKIFCLVMVTLLFAGAVCAGKDVSHEWVVDNNGRIALGEQIAHVAGVRRAKDKVGLVEIRLKVSSLVKKGDDIFVNIVREGASFRSYDFESLFLLKAGDECIVATGDYRGGKNLFIKVTDIDWKNREVYLSVYVEFGTS